MRIALVHDQLQEFGGAERVFLALKKIYPSADIYTAFLNEDSLDKNAPGWRNWKIYTSWAAKIPFIGKLYSPLRFLAPTIWESFNFSSYDLVISSSGWYMCKGIKTVAPTIHISYVHHPPRYLYGYETAVEWQKYFIVKIYALIVNFFLRKWDYASSQRPTYLVANSFETKDRIQKLYNRTSDVIYPPVDVPKKYEKIEKEDYYVTVSRLAKAKHIDLLIQVANEKRLKLKVVGNGRELPYLQSIAGDTIEFVSNASDTKRDEILKHAKAFLVSAVDEEFGIAPVEAMGYGTPVIALKDGGLKETVKDGVNGYLFDKLTTTSLNETLTKLNGLSKAKYNDMCDNARRESEKYSFEKFKELIEEFVRLKTS